MSARNKFIIIIIALLALLSIFWTKNWFGDVLPLSPREENIPELSYFWNLYHAASEGILSSAWNPLQIMGTTNLTQRGYLLFAPLTYVSLLLHLSPDVIYKISVPIIFFISGLGMYFFSKELKLSPVAALVSGTIYMLAPPHLAIGIEGFDFNVFWAIIPWCLLIFEQYLNKKKLLLCSVILGILLTIALIVGTTYFVLTIPIFAIYIFLRIFLTKQKNAYPFIFLSCLIFFTTSAFITIPSIIETKYSWISKETTRKKIINLPTPVQLMSLYPKRLQNYSVLAVNFQGNFADMSWYLGITTVALAAISLFSKQSWKIKGPLIFLIIILLPFYAIIKFAAVKTLFIAISEKIPRLQALYDQTYRLFLPITFSLATLAGFGTHFLGKLMKSSMKNFFSFCIFAVVIVDLFPFTQFFRSVPMSTINKDLAAYELINQIPNNNRYWSPFPFIWHLPKYRWEYLTKFLTKNRVNSSFLYIPYSSRYSSEIYDVFLAGALEDKKRKVMMEDVITALDWGNADYIFLRPGVFNYSNAISELEKYGFTVTYQSETLLLLTRTSQSKFLNLYQSFQKVPSKKSNDLNYWFKSYQKGIILYDGNLVLSARQPNHNSGAIVKWQRFSPDIIQATVSANQPLLLTVSESWYPGWGVRIDNKHQDLVRANYAFLGVIVPQGYHEIVFSYKQPWYYLAGRLISIISLVFLTLVIFIKKLTTYKKS